MARLQSIDFTFFEVLEQIPGKAHSECAIKTTDQRWGFGQSDPLTVALSENLGKSTQKLVENMFKPIIFPNLVATKMVVTSNLFSGTTVVSAEVRHSLWSLIFFKLLGLARGIPGCCVQESPHRSTLKVPMKIGKSTEVMGQNTILVWVNGVSRQMSHCGLKSKVA